VHLYHPPQQRLSRQVGSVGNKLLHDRYRKAHKKPDIMRELLQEAA
jgi:hypothetical protein